MKDFKYCKELFELIDLASIKSKRKIDDECKKLNRKYVGYIKQWVNFWLHHTTKEVDAYNFWLKLKSVYEWKTAQNKDFMIRMLVSLKYRDRQSVVQHLNNFQELLIEFSTINLVMDDEVVALLLLSSLSHSW